MESVQKEREQRLTVRLRSAQKLRRGLRKPAPPAPNFYVKKRKSWKLKPVLGQLRSFQEAPGPSAEQKDPRFKSRGLGVLVLVLPPAS